MSGTGQPLVSVILTSFNRAQWLGAAIQSVLEQTYAEIQIVIVDDASTDDSPDIIRTFERLYGTQITSVLLEQNGGVANARNAALAKCRGSYVTNLDGDDVYLPGKIAAELALVRDREHASVAYSNFQWADENLCPTGTWANPGDEVPEGFVLGNLLRGKFPSGSYPSYPLVPRSSVGNEWNDLRFPIYEDLDLMIRLSTNHRFYFSSQMGWIYRRHGQGLSASKAAVWCEATLLLLRKNRQYLELLDPALRNRTARDFRAQVSSHAVAAALEAYARSDRYTAIRFILHACLLQPSLKRFYLLLKMVCPK